MKLWDRRVRGKCSTRSHVPSNFKLHRVVLQIVGIATNLKKLSTNLLFLGKTFYQYIKFGKQLFCTISPIQLRPGFQNISERRKSSKKSFTLRKAWTRNLGKASFKENSSPVIAFFGNIINLSLFPFLVKYIKPNRNFPFDLIWAEKKHWLILEYIKCLLKEVIFV